MPYPAPVNRPAITGSWFALQTLAFILALAALTALYFAPTYGLHAIWNVLIPAAPLLFVFLPGLWRNICPLATAALLPRKLGLSSRRRMGLRTNRTLRALSIAALLVIVPLRHVALDIDATFTLVLLLAAGLAAFALGLIYEWKSAWCSGLCPVQAVERLYGARPVTSFANARCSSCAACTQSCNDSLAQPVHDQAPSPSAGTLEFLAAGFPGFVWAWFQIPNYVPELDRTAHTLQAYGLPWAGFAVSAMIYTLVRRLGAPSQAQRIFATTAVAIYYFYRLPLLVGFSQYASDGVLVDLTGVLPPWTPALLRIGTTSAILFWMLSDKPARKPWLQRPPYQEGPLHRVDAA